MSVQNPKEYNRSNSREYLRQSTIQPSANFKLKRQVFSEDGKLQLLTLRELTGYEEEFIYRLMNSETGANNETSNRYFSSSDKNIYEDGYRIDNLRLFRSTNKILARTVSNMDELGYFGQLLSSSDSHENTTEYDVSRLVIPNLTLGEKNMALLLLRKLTLGDKLILLTNCPYCKEKMTQVVSISKLIRSELDRKIDVTNEQGRCGARDVTIMNDQNGTEYKVKLRPMTVGDLHTIHGSIREKKMEASYIDNLGEDSMKRFVIERVIETNILESIPSLPTNIYDKASSLAFRIMEELGELDPLSNIRFSITCPVCNKNSVEDFYPEYFVFSEIADYHKKLEDDLNWIALHYGWSEQEIMEMAISKRKKYIKLINQIYSGE